LSFEGATADGFETTLAVVDPTADRTLTLPNVTGTFVTTGDTGTVTSTMLLDGTILNADVNASAAIAGTKISPDFGSQTIVTTGVHSAAAGSAAAPSIAFTGDLDTGIYSPGANQVAVATNGTGRLFVDASGNIGVATATPNAALEVNGIIRSGTGSGASLATGSIDVGKDIGLADGQGIVMGSARRISMGSTGTTTLNAAAATAPFIANIGASEVTRIDSSGRLLVGTSTAKTNYFGSASIGSNFQVVGSTHAESSVIIHNQAANTQAPYLHIGKARGTGYEIVSNADLLGSFVYFGADGSAMRPAASIDAYVDGTPGANDMPGRLVFSTTADGAASPTERMRIKSNGIINFSNAPTYADNATAAAAGLAVGDVYKTVLGVLMIRY
jgi:hypothetical protein